MAVLSDTDLQAFSDLATDLALKDTCDILAKDETWDPQGGHSDQWPATNTQPIPCLVEDARFPAERVVAEQLTDRMDKIISMPRLTAVRKENRIRVTQANGTITYYHIIGVVEPSTYEVLRRVVATREDVPVT